MLIGRYGNLLWSHAPHPPDKDVHLVLDMELY